MIEKVKQYFYDLCKDKHFRWEIHVESVVKLSKKLAKQLGADEEVVEVAAWLHDIKKIQGEREKHHVYGSEQAGEILKQIGYDDAKIEKVKRCILTHSSDKAYPTESIEEKVLASADALSHFYTFTLLVQAAYLHVKPEEVKDWLLNKYTRSFGKMMPEAKKLAEKRYEAIKLLLEES